ncbi:RagB/SusD family nutrient uptake outer membrane protein [Parabacteroides sp. OttesenSCG-928-G06]|nr:RagB/SusD family nutrient uptake outer membrane protein [Parabacteroides sp. OttesenSCG-928-G06]
MKNLKSIILSGTLLVAAGLLSISCDDMLDRAPIDYYGSGSYWKNEAHVAGYVDGLHNHLRSASFQHLIMFGELRGGHYRKGGVSCDGMTLSSGDVLNQNFDKDRTGVSKFGDLYGRITNTNLLIARVTDADYMDTTKKNYYLAIAYGLRAFYYFDLYRVYGGVPLRLGVEVIDGELDPNKLYLGRAKPSEVMAQIKSDLQQSLSLFGNVNDFNPYGHGKKCYWNKAATECLTAEVYLWNAKVTTGDNAANTADLATAKTHLQNVMNNYGLKMLNNFASVFDAKNKANDEVIMAVRYLEGEASNNYGYYTYSIATGSTNAGSLREDGTPWNDPLGLKTGYGMSYEYDQQLFLNFDKEDSRRNATFMGSYRKNEAGEMYLNGTHVVKNIGYINSTDNRVFCGDEILYRLPWVYLSLAEIANMEGNNADVEKYINLVRQRAYADNWDAAVYGYTAGDFTQNELAILHEKDKEFVQEGQRWWDLRRMTLTKGGKHLVFCKEGSLVGELPILDEAKEAHKVLWPLDKAILGNDPALEQTPGY